MSPTRWLVSCLILVAAVPPARAGEPIIDDASLRQLVTDFPGEPDVRAVQQAALRHAEDGLAGLDRWRRRARWSNLVPDVDGEFAWLDQRDSQLQYDEDITTGEDGSPTRDQASNRFVDDLRVRALYGVELQFDLGGLVFDRDELSVARESRARTKARAELMAQVTTLYFERRHRQILQRLAAPTNLRERLTLILEIERLTAEIDALTGGWFATRLGRGGGSARR
jgi:hypothetical protein